MGIEVIAVSAFEARDLASLRRPSRVIAYFIFAIYMFSVIGQYLNVKWTSNALPHLHTDSLDPVEKSPYPTSAIFIIAALQAGYTKTAAFLNGCIIFSALSASNSGLYIASRTLYGLTRTVSPYGWLKWVSKLGTVWHKNRVPMWALFFSAVAFLWLPFLQINQDVAIVDLYEIMSTTSSLACFLVWAIECLAFIRYYAWLRKHQERVAECYPEFDRWAKTSQATTFLAGLQPLIAWIGMIGSFVVVFVFATAAWWTGRIDFRKVAVSYAGVSSFLPTNRQSANQLQPVILTIVVLVFKAFTRRPPVVLDDDASELFRALEHLKWLKPDQERHRDTESRGSTTPQGSNISMGNISHPLKAFSRTTDRSISSAQSQRTGDTR